MHWVRRNAVGLLGLALAAAALVVGAEAYRTGMRRDEQARAIPKRLERGEVELAEQHRKSVAVLSDYSDALRAVTFYAVGAAAMVGAWHLRRRRPNVWLTGAVVLLAVGAVLLAVGSRAAPGVAPDPRDL